MVQAGLDVIIASDDESVDEALMQAAKQLDDEAAEAARAKQFFQGGASQQQLCQWCTLQYERRRHTFGGKFEQCR